MNKGTSKAEKKQDSRELENKCWEFLRPVLEQLHQLVDRRVVKTLLDLVMVIVMHRNRNHGLLLSELGDHLLGGRARTSRGKTNCQFVAFSEMGKSIALELYVEMRGGKGPGIGCPKSASLCHMG